MDAILRKLKATGGHRVQHVRPENRIHEMSLLEKAGYLCKYFLAPSFEASPALLAHFARQRAT